METLFAGGALISSKGNSQQVLSHPHLRKLTREAPGSVHLERPSLSFHVSQGPSHQHGTTLGAPSEVSRSFRHFQALSQFLVSNRKAGKSIRTPSGFLLRRSKHRPRCVRRLTPRLSSAHVRPGDVRVHLPRSHQAGVLLAAVFEGLRNLQEFLQEILVLVDM